jgi:hypothetical protein
VHEHKWLYHFLPSCNILEFRLTQIDLAKKIHPAESRWRLNCGARECVRCLNLNTQPNHHPTPLALIPLLSLPLPTTTRTTFTHSWVCCCKDEYHFFLSFPHFFFFLCLELLWHTIATHILFNCHIATMHDPNVATTSQPHCTHIRHNVHPGVCATSPRQATLHCLSAEYFCSFHSLSLNFFV